MKMRHKETRQRKRDKVWERCGPTLRLTGGAKRQGGFLYVAVLFTSLLLLTIVTTALSLSASQAQIENDRVDRSAVLRAAESETFRFAATMQQNNDWRSENESNVFSPWRDPLTSTHASPIMVRHRLTDVDGSLADDLSDAVTLTVQARNARADYAVSVDLQPDPIPYGFLQHAITTTEDLSMRSGVSVTTDGSVDVAGSITKESSASPSILTTTRAQVGSSIEVDVRGEIAASDSFETVDLVSIYSEQATPLDASAIPLEFFSLSIKGRLISPSSNPFGETSSNGIYVLDAGGRGVIISNCRLVATLVVVNASFVTLGGGMVWESPNQADAILLSDAPISFFGLERVLDENSLGVNFNPASTPYRQTESNSLSTDSFPTMFRGLVATPADITVSLLNFCGVEIEGALFCHELRANKEMQVRSVTQWLDSPPAGLSDGATLRWVRGTWRRIESPL